MVTMPRASRCTVTGADRPASGGSPSSAGRLPRSISQAATASATRTSSSAQAARRNHLGIGFSGTGRQWRGACGRAPGHLQLRLIPIETWPPRLRHTAGLHHPRSSPMKGDPEVIECLKELLRGELAARDQYFLHSRRYEDLGLKALYER